MQFDGHHAATYVTARIAGFTHGEAEVISYAAQYVDDATNAGPIQFADSAYMYARIPAPTHVGPGNFKAPTVLCRFAIETHENRLNHSPPLSPRKIRRWGKGVFCFSKMKLDSFTHTFYGQVL